MQPNGIARRKRARRDVDPAIERIDQRACRCGGQARRDRQPERPADQGGQDDEEAKPAPKKQKPVRAAAVLPAALAGLVGARLYYVVQQPLEPRA